MTPYAVPASVSVRNILFPTDFSSPCTDMALAYSAELARRSGATLNLVTVVPQVVIDYAQPPDPFYLRHSAEKNMARLARQETLRHVLHCEFVKDGLLPDTLASLMSELGIDMVVLGVHSKSSVKQLLLGSAAEEIIHTCPCPVVAIGPSVMRGALAGRGPERIMYAARFLHNSGSALSYALWMGDREHIHLAVLHVFKTATESLSHQDWDGDSALQELAELLPPSQTIETEVLVKTGDPAQQILIAAESQRADLLVIGPQPATPRWASTHLPWRTTHHLICHAHCPVLVVHE